MENQQFFVPRSAQEAEVIPDLASKATTQDSSTSWITTHSPANLEYILPSEIQTLQPVRQSNAAFVHGTPHVDRHPALNGEAASRLSHFRGYPAAARYSDSSFSSGSAAARRSHSTISAQPRPFTAVSPRKQQSSLELLAPMNVADSSTTRPPAYPEDAATDEILLDLAFLRDDLGNPEIFAASQQNGRTLAHAVATMTGESPAGSRMRAFTGSELIAAIKSGRAYITLEGPLSTSLEQIAQQMGYSVNDLTQASAAAAARVSAAPIHSIDLHGGMFVHFFLPHIPDVPFERKRGGGSWLPPAGLLELHLVSGEVVKHFDLKGSFSPIYSQVSPPQADVTLLGAQVTLWELAAFFPTHGRYWKDFSTRIVGNGVTATEFARLANMIRGANEKEGLLKTTIENQFAKYAPLDTREKVTTFCCCDWEKPKNLILIDYPLKHLVTGINRARFPPSGPDRGPLTECVEWVLDHSEDRQRLLSDVRELVSERQLGTPAPFADVLSGSTSLNADEAAIQRLKPKLGEYRGTCEEWRETFPSAPTPNAFANSEPVLQPDTTL